MNKLFLSLLTALLLVLSAAGCSSVNTANPAPPVRAVDRVDLPRYLGRWYEIAAFPMYFQRQCVGDTTADYTLRPDGELTVLNRCRTVDGFDQARGHAWPVEGGANARLKVSFFWPFRADYWVIGLDDNYRWAVVGNPNREYLWVLSRTPRLAPDDLARAIEAARKQGYDPSRLRYTSQTAG